MKKISALVLAMAMALSLVACGGTGGNSGGGNGGNNSAASNNNNAAASQGSAAGSAGTGGYEATGTLTIIVPYAAGGAVDLGSRLLAKYAANYTDANIVVTNVSGGGGTVGIAELLKNDADGTYMVASNPSPTYIATADKPLTFDFMTDLAFVSLMVQDQRVMVVPKDNGSYTTLEEFVDYCKANPGKVNVGCSGSGNSAYFTPYLLNQAAGIEMNIVAFDGASEAKAALLGGHIQAASISYSEALPMMQNDQIIVLGVASAERFDKLPDVPTFKEKGYDVQMFTSRGYSMKAGTDPQIVQYWSDIIGKVCEDEGFLAEADGMGLPIVYMDHNAFADQAAKEMADYAELVATVG